MKHEQDIRPLVPPKPEELEGWQERARALLEGNFEKPSRGSGIDTRDMFYIPTINLYFSKQRTHDKETWNKAWEALANEKVLIPNIGERALRMPTIEEFRKALIYFKNSPNSEHKKFYNEITEVRNLYRANWLDAFFEQRDDGMYILTKNKAHAEKLQSCLMEDKTPGINLEKWLEGNNATSQGLPKKDIEEDKKGLWYWAPVDGRVAGFVAGSGGASLYCDGVPDVRGAGLGVFGVAEGGS